MQPFKMWNFLIILGVFLFIDVLYLSIWTGAFPFRRALAQREVHVLHTTYVLLDWDKTREAPVLRVFN